MALIDIINKWAIQPEDPNAIPTELLEAVSHESAPAAQPVEVKPSVEQRFSDSDADRKMASRAELETLLKSFDDASSRQRRGNIAAGLSEAGMEFGRAFGGQEVDKNWTQGMRDRAGQEKKDVLDKNKLSLEANKESRDEGDYAQKQMVNIQKMDETGLDIDKKGMSNSAEKELMDGSSAASKQVASILREAGIETPSGADARSMLTIYPFAKEKFESSRAKLHETSQTEREDMQQKGQTKREGMQQYGATQREKMQQAGATGREGLKQQTKEYIGSLKGSERDMKLAQVAIPGLAIDGVEDGYIPHTKNANNAKDENSAWNRLEPIMKSAMEKLKRNGKNVILTEDWNRLKSQWAAIAEAKNKVNGNGVMNFNDWDNLMKEIGDPNTLNQWLSSGAMERLDESLKTGEIQHWGYLKGQGYVPGETKPSQIRGYSGSGGQSGSSGPVTRMSVDDINAQLGAAGLPAIQGRQSGVAPQSQQTQNQPQQATPTNTIGKHKATKQLLRKWSDGSWRPE